jgi:hypothetical protein
MAAEQVEFNYDTFAEDLERDFALMIMPHYGDGFTREAVRLLSARLAMLASRRAREVGKLPDFQGVSHFCPNCTCWSCQVEKTSRDEKLKQEKDR